MSLNLRGALRRESRWLFCFVGTTLLRREMELFAVSYF